MTVKERESVSYKEALEGEARLDGMIDEINRTCALLCWRTDKRRVDKVLTHSSGDIGVLDVRPPVGDYHWVVIFGEVSENTSGVTGYEFVYQGYPTIKWSHRKKLELFPHTDKTSDIPQAYAHLQELADGLCEKFPGLRLRLLELVKIGSAK